MRTIGLVIALAAGANLAAAQEAPNPAVIGLRLFSAICLDTQANLAAVAEASESYGLSPGALTDIPTTTRGPRNDPGVQIEGRARAGNVFQGEVEGRPVVVIQHSRSQGRGRSATTVPACDLYMMGASEAEIAQLIPESMREGFRRTPFAMLTLNNRRFAVAASRLSRNSPYTEHGTMAYFSSLWPTGGGSGSLMIGYVTLGTNDLERAAQFYDAIAAELGTKRMMEWPGAIAWGTPGGGAGIGLTKPFNGEPATVGNGVMVALECKDKAQVDRLYNLAMSLGASDEGPPGPRGDTFYAAYFRDPDGNKLNAFVMG